MCLPYGPFYRKQTHLGTKYQGMQQTHVNPEYQIFHQPFPNSSVPNSWHHLKKLVKGWRGSGLRGAASGQETLCLDTVHYWHFDLTWRVADMKVKVFSWMHSGKVAVLIRSVKSITHTHTHPKPWHLIEQKHDASKKHYLPTVLTGSKHKYHNMIIDCQIYVQNHVNLKEMD